MQTAPQQDVAIENGTHSIPHDFKYFKGLVLGNKKALFTPESEDANYKEERLRTDYKIIMGHIDMYLETIDESYPNYSDFTFLKDYFRKIYQALYTETSLMGVFETPEDAEQFFEKAEKYLFEDFGKKHLELTEKYPKEKSPENAFLTSEEVDALLLSEDEYKAKYGTKTTT